MAQNNMARVGVLGRQTSEERVMKETSSTARGELDSYERNLRGLKQLSLVTDITTVCNWSLAFCALTWASAVLLGAYITDLSVWEYYEVSVLLFVEGLRFGVAALLRTVGIYRLGPWIRWFLRAVGIFIPLWMGGFALLSILPTHIIHHIRNVFLRKPSALVDAQQTAPTMVPARLSASLTIFYSFILANALVLLLGRFIAGLISLLCVKNNDDKSIHSYHDKISTDSSGWMQAAGIDLDHTFKMQSFEYKRRQTADKVCKEYASLIRCLYMHEKGVEAVEAALGAEDVYVREAAANVVGFFAVLEKTSSNETSVPLCYQVGLLAKLAKLVGGVYSTTSTAATRSFAMVMEANRGKPEMINKLGFVQSGESKVGDILQERYREVKGSMAEGKRCLCPEKSDWHLYARWKLLHYQQAQANEEGGAEGGMNILGPDLLSADQREEMDHYYKNIKATFEEEAKAEGFGKRYCKIGIFLLVNVALPLTLGFIASAYLRH